MGQAKGDHNSHSVSGGGHYPLLNIDTTPRGWGGGGRGGLKVEQTKILSRRAFVDYSTVADQFVLVSL